MMKPRKDGRPPPLPPSQKKNTRSKNPPFKSLLSFLLLIINLIDYVSCVAVHEVRFIASKSGRTDYALTNETIELSCHYLMKDDLEDVKQLVWSRDGQNILRWRKGEPGLKVLSYTYKGHIDNTSTSHHIIIHNVTIEMHGRYKCSIRTDLGIDENEQNVAVITQPACRLGDWRIRTDPTQCRETLVLDCRNMFPKPAPSCWLWNSKLEKIIMGLSVDISEEPSLESPNSLALAITKRQQTYRVRYVQQFDLLPWPPETAATVGKNVTGNRTSSPLEVKNKPISPAYLLQFAGHLWLKCDIVVPETSWKMSLTHKMFDYSDACLQDPLETIAKLRLRYSQYAANQMQQAGYLMDKNQIDDFELLSSNLKYELMPGVDLKQVELNCWRKPKLGTLARLSCVNPKFHHLQLAPLIHQRASVKLKGASLWECKESGWVPVKASIISKVQGSKETTTISRLRKILRQRSSGNATSTTTLPFEGQIPQQKNGTTTTTTTTGTGIATQELTYIQAIDSNDLEDDNDDSGANGNQEAAKKQATTAATTNHEDPDESLDIIPSVQAKAEGDNEEQQQQQQRHITQAEDPLSFMQPSELAAILPTCVSPKARSSSRVQQQAAASQKDHDLQHDGRQIHILESSGKQKQPTTSGGADDDKDGFFYDLGSIFNFHSSRSSAVGAYESARSYSTTMLCCLVAALLFRIANHPSHHQAPSRLPLIQPADSRRQSC